MGMIDYDTPKTIINKINNNYYDVVSPFISNILMKFLLTISHIFLMKFVLRFGVGSNDNHLVNSFFAILISCLLNNILIL